MKVKCFHSSLFPPVTSSISFLFSSIAANPQLYIRRDKSTCPSVVDTVVDTADLSLSSPSSGHRLHVFTLGSQEIMG